ncbi:E3 ubiquitin protein ligase RIE1-like protein [Tanacetum coccineum]
MASTSSPEITPIIEPIVSPRNNDILPRSPSTSVLSMFLGLFAGRRGAPMIVRENVAHQLESWREDWGYSLPVVVFDTVWNLMFVVAAIVILFLSVDEKPNVPLRVWIFGYVVQCFVHVVLLWLEFRKRNRIVSIEESLISSGSSSEEVDGDSTGSPTRHRLMESLIRSDTSFDKIPYRRWERLNTVISYIGSVIGFIWIISAYKVLLHVAPRLFWLTLAFLAIDMFFAAIGYLLSLLVGLAVCFCFPCIIGIMYFIRCQEEGASDADINVLPKYIYAVSNDEEQPDVILNRMVPMGTNGPDFERFLQTEDAYHFNILWSNTPFTSLQPSLPCCMHPEMAKGKSELSTLQAHYRAKGTCLKSTISSLENKVAIVIGGAQGIGECIVRLFVKYGAKVVIADVNVDLGELVCRDLGSEFASFVHCDVTIESDIENVINTTIAKHGQLDIMVNNTGTIDEPKLRGVATHAYTSSKHGVVGLAENVAAELGKYNIRVNCVSPYVVPTKMAFKFLYMEETSGFYSNLDGKELRST